MQQNFCTTSIAQHTVRAQDLQDLCYMPAACDSQKNCILVMTGLMQQVSLVPGEVGSIRGPATAALRLSAWQVFGTICCCTAVVQWQLCAKVSNEKLLSSQHHHTCFELCKCGCCHRRQVTAAWVVFGYCRGGYRETLHDFTNYSNADFHQCLPTTRGHQTQALQQHAQDASLPVRAAPCPNSEACIHSWDRQAASVDWALQALPLITR